MFHQKPKSVSMYLLSVQSLRQLTKTTHPMLTICFHLPKLLA